MIAGMAEVGVPLALPIFEDLIALSQPEGADYAHGKATAPHIFFTFHHPWIVARRVEQKAVFWPQHLVLWAREEEVYYVDDENLCKSRNALFTLKKEAFLAKKPST